MIHRLRKKFIRICMLSFLAAFLTLFGAMYLITALQTDASLDTLADIVSGNDGRFPDFEEFDGEEGQGFRPEGITQESPFTTRFFTVRFGADGQISTVDTRSIASVTQEQAVRYAAAALEQGRERGWEGEFRYKVYTTDDGAAVVFINGTEARAVNQRFILSASAVFLGGSLVVLLLVVLFSKRAVRPAAESYEKQKQFITDANHELKTPLTLIRTNLDILEAERGPSEWLTDIREETELMTQLVGRLVALTRMDEAETRLDMRPFRLSETVAETVSAFAPAAAKSGRELTADIAPDVMYTGDEAAIRQLTAILLDNAVKYCDPGGAIRAALTGGRHPVLTVDNSYQAVGGVELGRLFDRFYRGDRARTYGGGFGIGLSIAKAVVEKHRGEITALSLDGRGIRFRVRL